MSSHAECSIGKGRERAPVGQRTRQPTSGALRDQPRVWPGRSWYTFGSLASASCLCHTQHDLPPPPTRNPAPPGAQVWDLARGFCQRSLVCHSSVNSVRVSLDGSLAISGHFDGTLRFWDLRSGRVANEVAGLHTQQITSVAVGLATGARGRARCEAVRLICHPQKRILSTYKGRACVAASLAGAYVLAAGQSGRAL